jgi:hypothetical protein
VSPSKKGEDLEAMKVTRTPQGPLFRRTPRGLICCDPLLVSSLLFLHLSFLGSLSLLLQFLLLLISCSLSPLSLSIPSSSSPLPLSLPVFHLVPLSLPSLQSPFSHFCVCSSGDSIETLNPKSFWQQYVEQSIVINATPDEVFRVASGFEDYCKWAGCNSITVGRTREKKAQISHACTHTHTHEYTRTTHLLL